MPDALRLSFEFRDGKYVSLPAEKVRMIVPKPPIVPGERSRAGHFVELRSGEDDVLFAARVGESGPLSVEFPTGDPEKPFGRTDPPPGSLVTVVVPSDQRATHAALTEVSASRERGLLEVRRRDLAVVSLTDEAL